MNMMSLGLITDRNDKRVNCRENKQTINIIIVLCNQINKKTKFGF